MFWRYVSSGPPCVGSFVCWYSVPSGLFCVDSSAFWSPVLPVVSFVGSLCAAPFLVYGYVSFGFPSVGSYVILFSVSSGFFYAGSFVVY